MPHEARESVDSPQIEDESSKEVVPGALLPPETAHPSPPWNTTTKAIVSVATVLLSVIVIWRFRDLIQPVLLAIILAYLLNPLVQLAQNRLKFGRGAAVALVYGITIVLLLGALGALGYVAYEQTDRLSQTLPQLVDQSSAWVRQNVMGRELRLGPLVYAIPVFDDAISPAEMLRLIAINLNLTPSRGGSIAAVLASTTIGVISTLFVIMFIAIYISKDSPMIWGRVAEVARAPGYHADAQRLQRDFLRIWDAYLRGQVLLGLSMFVLVSIVLSILGVNYSLALGALSGLLEFLPVIGPLIATIAAALVALFQDSNWLGLSPAWYALLVIGLMFALQQIESAVLVPRFVGEALDLHPIIIIVVVLMGTSLAGILGAVLAAPVAATVKLFGGYGWRKMFDLPPFPTPEPVGADAEGGIWKSITSLWSRNT